MLDANTVHVHVCVTVELIKYNLDDCVMYEDILCWSVLILTCNYRTGEINWDEESRQKKNEQQYKSFKETSGKETQKAKMIHAELKLPNKPGRSITNFEIQNLNQNQYI